MAVSSPLFILALLLFAIAVVSFVVVSIQDRRKAVIDARMKMVMQAPIQVEEIAAPTERDTLEQRVSRLLRSLPANMGERLEAAVATTGGKVTPLSLLIAALIAAVVSFLLGTFFNFDMLIIVFLVIGATYYVPILYFRRARGKYRTDFLEVFPDALDLIARIVRAGVPVSTGIEVAGRESPEPVKSIFAELASQNRVGISFEDGLTRMVKRLNITDFSFFASALILQRESGGNIAETVSNLSAIVRKRKELRKKGEALTAEARTVAGVLSALPFLASGLVALVNFSYISLLFTDTRGNIIMGVALLMLSIGIGIMRTMVNNALR
jgi:tight adherence protein B